MTAKQQTQQKQTAAYEALLAIRKHYPWREQPPSISRFYHYLAKLQTQMIQEMSSGCLPLLVER